MNFHCFEEQNPSKLVNTAFSLREAIVKRQQIFLEKFIKYWPPPYGFCEVFLFRSAEINYWLIGWLQVWCDFYGKSVCILWFLRHKYAHVVIFATQVRVCCDSLSILWFSKWKSYVGGRAQNGSHSAPASPVEEPFKQPLALSHKFIHSKNKRKTRMQFLERSVRVKHRLC